MSSKRFAALSFSVALVLVLLPAGVQATPPIGGDTSSFGISNDVGANAGRVYAVALGDLDNHGGQGLDDPRPVPGLTGIPPAGPVWAIASEVLAYDNRGPDGARSTAAAAGSAIMPETISAGSYHTCGLKADGSVACWGWDDYGQSTPPFHSAGFFAQVSAGGYHTCGRKANGTAVCWGRNDDGQSTPPQEPVYLPIVLRNR